MADERFTITREPRGKKVFWFLWDTEKPLLLNVFRRLEDAEKAQEKERTMLFSEISLEFKDGSIHGLILVDSDEGPSLAEQLESYVASCNLTRDDIESVEIENRNQTREAVESRNRALIELPDHENLSEKLHYFIETP